MIGTGREVADKIVGLAERLQAVEIAIVTWAYDERVRHKSYRLIADALGLTSSPAQGGDVIKVDPYHQMETRHGIL
jgi:hypothetical protein